MKKLSYIFITATSFALTLSSCKKDFLEERVYSSYAPQTLSDSLGLEASVVGLHNHLSQFFTYSDRQGWPSVWQVGTDIAYAAQQEGIEIPYFNYTQLNSNDAAAGYTWGWAYRMINNANIIINNVENNPSPGMGQNNRNVIGGEARFFRAYAYNILATCFGRVPVVTTPLTAPKTDFVRNPIEEVNNLIVEDLIFAGTNLPEPGNVGSKTNAAGKQAQRPHKYMAMHLLSEAYLRMGKNDLAEQQALAVINSQKFSLNTTRFGSRSTQPGDPFADMFIYGNQRRSQTNKETLWTMEMENPSTVTGGITGSPQQRRIWVPAYYQVAGMKIADSLGGRGIARLRLNDWVVYRLYEQNDIRNSPYNFRRQYYYNDPAPANAQKFGKPVPYSGFDTIFRIAPHTTKWYEFNPADEFGFAMIKDIILMRLGETYLFLAEAQFKQGKVAEAAATLNVIRGRANATPVTPAQVNLNFILDERARELVGEENRRMTLMRTGTLVERATRLNAVSPLNQLTGISNTHLLMPIPLNEINLNKDAVLEQNPGY